MLMFTKIYLLKYFLTLKYLYNIIPGVGLPGGPVARGQPKGRRASQSHIVAGPVGQP